MRTIKIIIGERFTHGVLILAATAILTANAAYAQPAAAKTRIQGSSRCTLAGSWDQTAENIGKSVWDIDSNGKAVEFGLGGATGTATLRENTLRIDWKTANGWSGYYEWLLNSSCNTGQGKLVFQSGGSGTQKTTVTRSGGDTSIGTSALPNPTSPAEGTSALDSTNRPQYFPDKLDFGEVWNGQSSTRILRLTTNASGYVRVNIPIGPYRVSEIREMGGGQTKGGMDTRPELKGPTGTLKGRITFPPGSIGPFTASADTGSEVQIYLVFEPKFDLIKMAAGEKSAAMKITGPGPKSEWALSVPMRGMFNGLVVGAVLTIDDREITALSGNANINVAVRLTGTDTLLQGNIRGKNLPPGIQINPVPVTVKSGQTTSFNVPVFLNWGMLKPDAQARNIELVFDTGGKMSSATFSLTPVPSIVSAGEPNRTNCGIDTLGWLVQLFPTGRVVLNLQGNNFDLVNNRDVIGTVNVAGNPVAWGIIHTKFGTNKPVFGKWDSLNVLTNVDFSSRFRAEDYMSAARDPITLTCKMVDSNSKLPF